jgi:hypothetical protein
LTELKIAANAGYYTLGSYEKSQEVVKINTRAVVIFNNEENYQNEKRQWLLDVYEELPEISRAEVRIILVISNKRRNA